MMLDDTCQTRRIALLGAAAALIVCALLRSQPADAAEPPTRAPADWFHVISLDARTYAISEPKYWQNNVSYLLLGTRTALLFDTGPGIYSIRAVVKSLTPLPILVIPSHLHFDHVGRIQEFTDIALLDTPPLRAQVKNGVFTDSPSQHMLEKATTFRVQRWLRDGSDIDLGGRTVRLISTPGHTPDSVTLIDGEGRRAFTGDLVNRIVSLYDVPGSDVGQAAASLKRVIREAPAGSFAFEAHAEAPLQANELADLAAGLETIAQGRAHSKPLCLGGQPMQSYEIGTFSALLPAIPRGTLRPLKSPTATLDWQGGACAGAK